MAKKVEENNIVPSAIGLVKKGKVTIFNTWILAPIIAITVYTYIPTSPNSFNRIKIVKRQKTRKINHIIIIGALLKELTNP